MPESTATPDLAIVLRAILDAKGFEEAQTALKKFGGATNDLKVPTERFAEGQRVSTREIKVLSAELLRSIGVTEGAGAAGRVAAESFLFMSEGIANATNLLLAGTGLIAVVAIPKLIEWITHTKESTTEQKELQKQLSDMLPTLASYSERIQGADEAVKEQLRGLRALEIPKQAASLGDYSDKIAEHEKKLQAARDAVEYWSATIESTSERHEKWQTKLAHATQAVEDEKAQIRLLTGQFDEMHEAFRKGISLEELREQKTKAATKADEEAKQATERRARAQKELNDELERAFKEGRLGQTETMLKSLQGALAKDSAKLAEDEKKRKKGALSDELIDLLTEFHTEEDIERERARLNQKDADDKKKIQAQTRADNAALAAESLSAITDFFGKNKAARIARSIADTYAAATRALAEGGPFAGPVLAAVMIARGLQNVAEIEKTKLGFDDPFSDVLAQKLGRRSAADFVRNFGIGFHGGMEGGAGSTTNNYYSTVNRGVTIPGGLHVSGVIGDEHRVYREINRRLIEIQRLEGRTTI